MAVKTYSKGSTDNLSTNFKVYEFSCKGSGCCSTTVIDEELVKYIQKIRNHFKKPVIINSAYRCPTHNKAVGGATNSYHAKGKAADIRITGVAPSEIAKYAESIGIKGIGLYETAKDGFFVHIDTRTTKSFWYGQKQLKRTTFGGNGNSKVKTWQTAAKSDGFALTADGIWGKKSEEVAKKAVCKKQLVGYKYPNLTKIIQKAVGVEADGRFGKGTKEAVIKWQKNNGLTADGIFGLNSWKKLLGIK